MSHDQLLKSRRNALKCTAYGGAGTLFALGPISHGVWYAKQ
jgi:hypothetical protein